MGDIKKFRILCLDGGGIRAVIPIQVLKYIEDRTKKQIHECFDLIAGTSTGGILACALTIPDNKSVIYGKRKFSLEKIEELYTKNGEKIFHKPKFFLFRFWQKYIKSIFYPEFKASNLVNTLTGYFEDQRISNTLKPIYITAFDVRRNIPIFFSTREASIYPEKNPLLVDVCRATSAAPTYFSAHNFNYDRENISCIDGGIFMNNPTLGAITEVLKNREDKRYDLPLIENLKDIAVLSLGTGISDGVVDSNSSRNWGLYGWARPVVDLTMNSPIKALEDQMGILYNLFGNHYNYLRVNISIEEKHSKMSNAKVDNMTYLTKQAESQIINNATMRLKIDAFLQDSGLL